MNKIIKTCLVCILVIISFFTGNFIVLADSNDFSVSPSFPSSQREGVESYFDIIVTPNTKQTLAINIKNNSSNLQKYNVIINTATTNQNGIVDYSVSDFEKENTMVISLKDIVSLENPQVEIEANSQKKVLFELNIPETPFKGILLGGVTVEPVTEETNDGIKNIITRTLAIQLSESDDKVVPRLEAGNVSVSQENYRNNVRMELKNVTPTLINRVTANILITKKGKNKPVFEQTREQLSIAPNSKFKLMSEWNDKFDAGSYVYNISLSDEQGNDWNFTKEFDIEEKKADALNKTSVDKKKKAINYYLLTGIALFITLLLISIYRIYKIKRMKNNLE